MKHILFSALFLISFVAASAQTTTPNTHRRYGRFEIRTRISHVETVNIGLAYFPTKKVK